MKGYIIAEIAIAAMSEYSCRVNISLPMFAIRKFLSLGGKREERML